MIYNIVTATSTKDVHIGGWKKDKYDARDYRLKCVSSQLNHAVQARPSAVDNSQYCSRIENQGRIGSCSAHVFASMVEYNDIRWNKTLNHKRISRLFEYYATRKIEGTVNEDSGACIRDAIKAGVLYGVVRESDWWYNEAKFAVNPSRKTWDNAALHKISTYHRIDDGDIETMKQVLANGYLIGFGFEVYDNMLTHDMAVNGRLHRPGSNETLRGDHAVCIVGFDDAKGVFKIRNSWGKDWALNGYYFMDYDYVADKTLCNDFWVINSSPNV